MLRPSLAQAGRAARGAGARLSFGLTLEADVGMMTAILMQNRLQTSDLETLGYHGTSQAVAKEIEQTSFKLSAPDSGAFLGEGVYFFDNQPSQAKRWARTRREFIGKPIAVIESRIRYGRLLNLTENEHKDLLNWFAGEFRRRSGTENASLAAIIDIAAEKLNVEVVKAVRIPGNAGFLMGTSFSADIEVILAVRNLTNILSKAIIWSQLNKPV